MGVVLKGPQGTIELGSTVVKVGRASENQLVVNDSEVSWLHAQIHPQGQGHIVVDLGSTNGTFVNDQRLLPHTPRQLHVGDTVRFGNAPFSYMMVIPQHPPTRAAAPVSMPNVGVFQQQQPPGNGNTLPKKDLPRWIKVVGAVLAGLASVATVFGVIWGIYTYSHPSSSPSSSPLVTPSIPSPTPTSSIPRLHSSYSGTLTRVDGQTYPLIISSLTEDAGGHINATGSDGPCAATFQGAIKSDETINFTVTEVAGGNCGFVGTFSGQLFSDGHLAGEWQGAFTQISGTWTVS